MLHPNILSARHRDEALAAIRKHKYEKTESGIFIPSMKLFIGGTFEVAVNDGPFEVCPNLVPTEGMNHILGVALKQATQKAAFYVALFSGNVTPQATWTGANFDTNATEFTNYNEATRVLWQAGSVTGGAVSNTATPAVFTMGTGGGTIRGAALLESSTKEDNSGVLIAASRLQSDKTLDTGEELRVKYSISVTSS